MSISFASVLSCQLMLKSIMPGVASRRFVSDGNNPFFSFRKRAVADTVNFFGSPHRRAEDRQSDGKIGIVSGKSPKFYGLDYN
jgi:hypothetical protein